MPGESKPQSPAKSKSEVSKDMNIELNKSASTSNKSSSESIEFNNKSLITSETTRTEHKEDTCNKLPEVDLSVVKQEATTSDDESFQSPFATPALPLGHCPFPPPLEDVKKDPDEDEYLSIPLTFSESEASLRTSTLSASVENDCFNVNIKSEPEEPEVKRENSDEGKSRNNKKLRTRTFFRAPF